MGRSRIVEGIRIKNDKNRQKKLLLLVAKKKIMLISKKKTFRNL